MSFQNIFLLPLFEAPKELSLFASPAKIRGLNKLRRDDPRPATSSRRVCTHSVWSEIRVTRYFSRRKGCRPSETTASWRLSRRLRHFANGNLITTATIASIADGAIFCSSRVEHTYSVCTHTTRIFKAFCRARSGIAHFVSGLTDERTNGGGVADSLVSHIWVQNCRKELILSILLMVAWDWDSVRSVRLSTRAFWWWDGWSQMARLDTGELH